MRKIRARLAFIPVIATAVMVSAATAAHAAIGDGTVDAVTGDDISETLTMVKDYGAENLTDGLTVWAYVLGMGFALAILVIGVRKILAKIKGVNRAA